MKKRYIDPMELKISIALNNILENPKTLEDIIDDEPDAEDERIQKALELAWRFGQIDGSHHRVWVIDQMVRVLCGDEETYNKWVKEYEDEGAYEWDTGIAP